MERIGLKFIKTTAPSVNLIRSGGFYSLLPNKDQQVAWVCQPFADPQETVPEMEVGWIWIEAAGLRLL